MGNILKKLLLGRYGTIDKFWNEYCSTYTKTISSSYRNKLWGGQREVPLEMLRNIHLLLGITTDDVVVLVDQRSKFTRMKTLEIPSVMK